MQCDQTLQKTGLADIVVVEQHDEARVFQLLSRGNADMKAASRSEVRCKPQDLDQRRWREVRLAYRHVASVIDDNDANDTWTALNRGDRLLDEMQAAPVGHHYASYGRPGRWRCC